MALVVPGDSASGTFLTVDDLSAFAEIDAAKAQEMIVDAEALAVLAAPCLAEPDELTSAQVTAVKAILRGAILRWNEAGTGALQQQQAGPFGQSFDTRNVRKGMFWPSEITQLQGICSEGSSGAFAVDTVGTGDLTIHADICSLRFGASYCSCGADLAGFPIYGTG